VLIHCCLTQQTTWRERCQANGKCWFTVDRATVVKCGGVHHTDWSRCLNRPVRGARERIDRHHVRCRHHNREGCTLLARRDTRAEYSAIRWLTHKQ